MSRWMKVAAVTLAAVVGLVPSFAQLSYAQALPEPIAVVPFGEELPDQDLLEIEGEWFWLAVLFWELVVGALVGWITYRQTGDVMESAIAGVGAMIVLTIGWGVTLPR